MRRDSIVWRLCRNHNVEKVPLAKAIEDESEFFATEVEAHEADAARHQAESLRLRSQSESAANYCAEAMERARKLREPKPGGGA